MTIAKSSNQLFLINKNLIGHKNQLWLCELLTILYNIPTQILNAYMPICLHTIHVANKFNFLQCMKIKSL